MSCRECCSLGMEASTVGATQFSVRSVLALCMQTLFANVFVLIVKCISPNREIYCYKLEDVFVQRILQSWYGSKHGRGISIFQDCALRCALRSLHAVGCQWCLELEFFKHCYKISTQISLVFHTNTFVFNTNAKC